MVCNLRPQLINANAPQAQCEQARLIGKDDCTTKVGRYIGRPGNLHHWRPLFLFFESVSRIIDSEDISSR